MTVSTIHQPADKLFKQAMRSKRVAKEFFTHHLPPALLAKINLDTLTFHQETFIDEEFKHSAADVVYTAEFMGGENAYLYTLVEHQSKNDPWLPLRMMKYLVRLLECHRKQLAQLPLPAVIPLIIYSGKGPYTHSTSFIELFGEQATLMKQLLVEPFQLVDVKKIDDEELQRYLWSGVLEFVLKHQYQRNFLVVGEKFFQWLQQLEQETQGAEYAKLFIYYIMAQTEGEKVKDFLQLANHYLSPQLRTETMTFAQQLRQEGIQQGLQQGKQQGLQQGKQQGLQQGKQQGLQQGKQQGEVLALTRLLTRKFPNISPAYLARLNQANETQLLAWFDRAIDATSLQEIFDEE